MKIALVNDSHWGVRNDTPVMVEHIGDYYDQQFFPKLEELGINRVIHLGDIVDRRKYVNYVTLNRFRRSFANPIRDRGMHLDYIVGNHDVPFKNTNEVNAMQELFGSGVGQDWLTIYSEADTVRIGDTDVLMMPWINSENYASAMRAMERTSAQVMFGHLEILGFEMYRGVENREGLDPSLFRRFDTVLSGHFHHRSTRGNITYLGTQYEMTWSDYDDQKGFHVFDTDTRELEFVPNKRVLHQKVWYDDKDRDMVEVMGVLKSIKRFKSSYVKVIVTNKTNPAWFDRFVTTVSEAGPINLQIVEDHSNQQELADDEILGAGEDTFSIMSRYIDGMETDVDKPRLKSLMNDVYRQALEVEQN